MIEIILIFLFVGICSVSLQFRDEKPFDLHVSTLRHSFSRVGSAVMQ